MATAAHGLDREKRIAEALGDVDVTMLDLWSELEALSSHIDLEGVEAPPEGVQIFPDGRFSAILNLYVVLRYEDDAQQESFSSGDSFLAKVAGTLHGDVPIIEHSQVDTSSFYN